MPAKFPYPATFTIEATVAGVVESLASNGTFDSYAGRRMLSIKCFASLKAAAAKLLTLARYPDLKIRKHEKILSNGKMVWSSKVVFPQF